MKINELGRRLIHAGVYVALIGIAFTGMGAKGCGGVGGGSRGRSATLPPRMEGIYVSSGSVNVMIGQTVQLSAVGVYSDGHTEPVGVLWSLTPSGFATIDQAGAVTGTNLGTTFATATSTENASHYGSVQVNVIPYVAPAPTITSPAIFPYNPTEGQAYTYTITKQDGHGTVTWSLSAGTLPPGMGLDEDTGVFSGSPIAGSYAFTVQVTDSVGQYGTKVMTFNVAATPPPPPPPS